MHATDIAPALSVVVPCHNEQGNLHPLIQAIVNAVEPLGTSFEIVLLDDCSTDGSWELLRTLRAAEPRLRSLRFEENRGQSAALWAGMQAARGRQIVTLDGDLQNDPADIPRLLEAARQFDCVCGTRVAARARGDGWVKRMASRVANTVRNRLSGETIEDAGCCFRAFKRECIAGIKPFRGFHRWLPTLIKLEGFTVAETPISHRPRASGRSHYGIWNRLFAGLVDLWAVRWMKQRMIRYKIADRVN